MWQAWYHCSVDVLLKISIKKVIKKIEFAIDIPWSEERSTFLSHILFFFLGIGILIFCYVFAFKKTSSSTEGRGKEFGTEFGTEAYPSMNLFFRLQKNELLNGTVDFWTKNGEFRPAVFTGIVIPARRCGGCRDGH